MVDGDISCPSVGSSDDRPWGDQVTVPGEFCWPPMGSFAWPPSAGDSAAVAAERGRSDHRCTHYWEEEDWPVSTRLRPILGFGPYVPEMSAWDVYLLYPPAVVWTNEYPPLPSDWSHNLRDYAPTASSDYCCSPG